MDCTDAPLVRHLAQTISLQAAGVYNRLPLFILPEEARELTEHEQDLLSMAPASLLLPFDDFLLDFPFGIRGVFDAAGDPGIMKGYDRGRLWVRVRSCSSLRLDDLATTLRPDQFTPLLGREGWIFLEGWEERTSWEGGLPPYPDYSAIPTDVSAMQDLSAHWHLYPVPECGEGKRLFGSNLGWCNYYRCGRSDRDRLCGPSQVVQGAMCTLAVLSLVYLSEGLGGATTEVSWSPRTVREEKTERLKPWVSPRRNMYIIIDPARAGEYGHPSSARPESAGHHASPIPHPRRGHWRRLAPDRRVKVRPTWVGAQEWKYEGRTYKILTKEIK